MMRADLPAPVLDEPASRQTARTPASIDPPGVDPTAFAEAAIAGILSLVCVNPHARRRLGLTAASRRADGWPAWYLWLAGSSGAYELALVPPAVEADSPPVGGADFALRYFPHPDEDACPAFAAIEQEARASALFDHTGTPAIETMDEMDPSLFHVATMSLRPSRGRDGLTLTLESQDIWLETSGRSDRPLIRRAVPGLALAAPIVDFIVCAHAYCGRRAPADFALTRAPGLAWHVDPHGAQASSSRDASLFTLRVDGLPALGVPESLRATADDGGFPARAGHTLVHAHQGPAVPPRIAPFSTDDWWKAATWRFYPVGAMCGCQVEDATVVGRDSSGSPSRRSVRQ